MSVEQYVVHGKYFLHSLYAWQGIPPRRVLTSPLRQAPDCLDSLLRCLAPLRSTLRASKGEGAGLGVMFRRPAVSHFGGDGVRAERGLRTSVLT